MNITVLIKQVPDTESKINVSADKKGIDGNGIKWVMNPYDEFAVEEAQRIKEANKAGAVTVITMGPDRAVEVLRTALAMGAEHAVHVKASEDRKSVV